MSLRLLTPWVLCPLLLASCVPSLRAAHPWQPAPDKLTLLAINAHPDDEGIFFGGALPYYSGVVQVPTMLISMTSGDWSPSNLTIREEELRNACWLYGLRHEPLFPRFRDVPSHSMSGNPYTNKLDATWDYWADGVLQGDGSDVAAGRARAVNYLAEQYRRFRPEVVITHDLLGEYGHDNHKATAIAATEALAVAADPSALATNLAGLPPWSVKKFYVHLLQTNRLFHIGWETSSADLNGLTPRQAADAGLDQHVSQGRPDVSTYYRTGENFENYDSEWWGLHSSTVGWDTPGTNGYAVGDFFQNLVLTNAVNTPPVFMAESLELPPVREGVAYGGLTLARYASDPDKVAGDTWVFTRVGGPDWLQVAPNGALSGLPGSTNVGTNTFTIRVTDAAGGWDEAAFVIRVLPALGDLAAFWSCNETSGPVLIDMSGSGSDAVMSNGATRAPGRDGGALIVDGTDDCATAPNLALGPELTVLAWIRSSSLSGDRAIIGESGAYTFKTSGTSLRFTTPGIRDHTYTAALVTNQWYHVAVTFRAGESNGCRFYVNGQLGVAVNASAMNTSANPTWLGRNQWGQYFAGQIDDVRVHRSVLSPQQIQAIFAYQPPYQLAIGRNQDGVTLQYLGRPGRMCNLLRSSNMTDWTLLGTQGSDADGRAVFQDSAPASAAFYRVRED